LEQKSPEVPPPPLPKEKGLGEGGEVEEEMERGDAIEEECVSAIKPFESFGDVDHTIKDLMSL
jgi:hypothetical protein